MKYTAHMLLVQHTIHQLATIQTTLYATIRMQHRTLILHTTILIKQTASVELV